MEKNRWSLIFIGLCLALAFSVSPVEAQKDCDADGDGYFKATNKCDRLGGSLGDDDDDTDCDIPFERCDNAVPATLTICHFKNILKHCSDGEEGFVGGGVRTIDNDPAVIARHVAHGDCFEEGDDFISNPDGDPITCGNHCIATRFPLARCGPVTR